MADEIVGKRILCEGFRGEIKYVGLVSPTSGTYVKNISSDIKQLECGVERKLWMTSSLRRLSKQTESQSSYIAYLYSGIHILLVWSICCFENKVMLIKRHITPNEPHFCSKKMLFTHFQTMWWYHRKLFLSNVVLCTCIWKDKRQIHLRTSYGLNNGKIKHKS